MAPVRGRTCLEPAKARALECHPVQWVSRKNRGKKTSMFLHFLDLGHVVVYIKCISDTSMPRKKNPTLHQVRRERDRRQIIRVSATAPFCLSLKKLFSWCQIYRRSPQSWYIIKVVVTAYFAICTCAVGFITKSLRSRFKFPCHVCASGNLAGFYTSLCWSKLWFGQLLTKNNLQDFRTR